MSTSIYSIPSLKGFWTEQISKCGITWSVEQYFWFWASSRSKRFKPVTLFKFYAINPLVNLDDKENEKEEGDKEKVVKIGEVQVFNEKGDTMTRGKRNLSRHQESAQKSVDPKELRSP